jgi:hypothetical protein
VMGSGDVVPNGCGCGCVGAGDGGLRRVWI